MIQAGERIVDQPSAFRAYLRAAAMSASAIEADHHLDGLLLSDHPSPGHAAVTPEFITIPIST
jgi:hypothetical protein